MNSGESVNHKHPNYVSVPRIDDSCRLPVSSTINRYPHPGATDKRVFEACQCLRKSSGYHASRCTGPPLSRNKGDALNQHPGVAISPYIS